MHNIFLHVEFNDTWCLLCNFDCERANQTVLSAAMARLEGVSKPDLLPAEYTNVIDVAGFLTPGEEERINAKIAQLEADTGFKLRVLAQNYPETPGLAIRYELLVFVMFWMKDMSFQ